jgi:predicted O-linked N-acetylglucosamine transferase (SPINDLY family)
VITFGTLNSPYKFTRAGLALWARVMRQVADSRFLFVHPSYKTALVSENIAREFESHGIARDRLTFINNRETSLSHFSYYEEMDLSLDTVPLTGGTTTADALWCGVPVVTLVGPAMHQRLSYSMLTNAGAGNLCAANPDEFVTKAVSLAGDRPALSQYRHSLRETVHRSALGDARLFTRNLEQILLGLVERHRLR